MTENELQKLCVEYLKKKNLLYYHSGFRGLHRTGTSSNVKGWPDLFVFIPGGVTKFIELKAGKGKLRPEQVEKIEVLVGAGFDCYVVDSLDKFVEIFRW
jgi:hypothetical protein